MNIAIIGNGIVGSNMQKLFGECIIHDPPKGFELKSNVDIGIVCVPTEMLSDGHADISIVKKAILQTKDKVKYYLIKSAIPPGTTDLLIKETGCKICVSPEYFGSTIHANNVDYGFLIVGGEPETRKEIIKAYKEIVHPNYKFYQTTAKTAELVKYMENCWLAAKVTFCNEFYRIAQKIGVDYNELRELWLADPRINKSHTFVYEDQPYYDSHCLNKDIPALIAFCDDISYNPELMRRVYLVNSSFKGK